MRCKQMFGFIVKAKGEILKSFKQLYDGASLVLTNTLC